MLYHCDIFVELEHFKSISNAVFYRKYTIGFNYCVVMSSICFVISFYSPKKLLRPTLKSIYPLNMSFVKSLYMLSCSQEMCLKTIVLLYPGS